MRYLLCALVLMSGCAAQIEQKMKTGAFLSPEAQGGWPRIEMGAGYQSAPTVIITDSVVSRPPDRTRSRIVQQDKIFLHGGVGVLEKMDISVDPASWLNLKYQFLGDPFTTAARGNFSLSGLASMWSSRRDDNGRNLELDPNARYNKQSFSWRLGVIGGYRLADSALIYVGLSHQRHRYSGDYTILSPVSAGRFAGLAKASAVTLGIEGSIGKNFVVRVEDAYSRATVPAFDAHSSQHSFGLLLAGLLGEPMK